MLELFFLSYVQIKGQVEIEKSVLWGRVSFFTDFIKCLKRNHRMELLTSVQSIISAIHDFSIISVTLDFIFNCSPAKIPREIK